MNKNFKQVITFTILMLFFAFLLTSCGTTKKQVQEKEIHYELVTTLRDSLVITHETQIKEIEKIIERAEEKKENADNYKRTEKDGTIHEYYNYNTEVKTDEKTKENITELISKYNSLEVKFIALNEKSKELNKQYEKERKQLDMFKLIIQVVGALLFIYLLYLGYRKLTKPKAF